MIDDAIDLSGYIRTELASGILLYQRDDTSRWRLRKRDMEVADGSVSIVLEPGADLRLDGLRLRGENCWLHAGRDTLLRGLTVTLKGDGAAIAFGEKVKTGSARMVAAEGRSIHVGAHSLFSHGITIRTSDMHGIFDRASGERINPGADVHIAERVWIAQDAQIQKGVSIGAGSVIGAASLVTRDVPEQSLAAGSPAHVLRDNIEWKR